MTEHTPQPERRFEQPVNQFAAAAEYREATPRQLRRAQFTNMTRLISADIGHFFVKATALHLQIYEILMGRSNQFDWDPDIEGLRPDLDEQQQTATEQLRLIWREMSMRRSRRQDLKG